MSDRDWKLHRKAQPASIVLPATRRWASELPPGLHPHVLLREFPRIANRIANAWLDAAACRLIFDDLLVNRRTQRKGFAPDVVQELLHLRANLAGEALPTPAPAQSARYWSARRMELD